jgi:transcriptional regulator with XRE-family HTH domain
MYIYLVSPTKLGYNAQMDTKHLQELRLQLNWSVEYAAKQLNYSSSKWYNMENGRTKVPAHVIQYLEVHASTLKKVDLVSRNLVFFRKRFSLTLTEAATLTKVSRVTWWRWETKRAPIPSRLKATLTSIGKTLTGE